MLYQNRLNYQMMEIETFLKNYPNYFQEEDFLFVLFDTKKVKKKDEKTIE